MLPPAEDDAPAEDDSDDDETSQSLMCRSKPPEATHDWWREWARQRTKSWWWPMTVDDVDASEDSEWGDQARIVRSDDAEMTARGRRGHRHREVRI